MLERATQSDVTKAPGLQTIALDDDGENDASGATPIAADQGPARGGGGATRSELHGRTWTTSDLRLVCAGVWPEHSYRW